MQIRPFERSDIPSVASLLGRAFGSRWDCEAALAAYIEDIFFRNPWVDPGLPSWAAIEADQLVGFIGVTHRPMLYKGARVRAAVLGQLMIEPQPRYAVAAAKLLRKALHGPQDLTLSDGATEAARRLWEAAGGSTSTLYTLQWRRLLRPAQYGLRFALEKAGRAAASVAGPLGTPLAAAVDAYAARRTGLGADPVLADEPLDAASLLAAHQAVPGKAALRPEYELDSLGWLLAHAQAKRRYGPLQGRILRERNGNIAGWYLYYLNSGTSKVLQLGAREGMQRAVLEHLFRRAWQGGATVIEGRMEPSFAAALGQLHCFFLSPSMYTLFGARDAQLLAALARGEALFSRLDGEWWMRFHGEPRAAGAAPERPAPLSWLLPRRTGVRPKTAQT